MRRTLQFLESEALEWDSRGCTVVVDMSLSMVQGRAAYAARQASIRRKMAKYCRERWDNWSTALKLGAGGIALEDDIWTFV